MKSAALLAAIASLSTVVGATCTRAQTDNDPGFQIRESRAVLKIRQGDEIKLKPFSGVNQIGKAADFDCKSSAGCLLTIQGFGVASYQVHSLSVLVDGIAATPAIYVPGAQFTALQSVPLAPGSHTVQAETDYEGDTEADINHWAFHYTMYKLRH